MREPPRAFVVGLLAASLILSGSAGAASSAVPAVPVTHLSQAAAHEQRPNAPRGSRATRPTVSTVRAMAVSPRAALQRIQQQLAERRRLLAEFQAEERRVLAQLSWVQERLERAQVRLHRTTAVLRGTKQEVVAATHSLHVVSGRLALHEALMDARLRAFYERGPLGYLDVLLGAANFRDFVTRSYLIGLVVERDLTLYRQVSDERRQQVQARAALAAREQRLAEERRHLVASRDQTAHLVVERRRLLAHVRTERAAQEAAIRDLENESARITDIIRRSSGGRHQGPVLTLRGGALRWPVAGRISSGYGWRIHPIFHTREFHTGIDIAAPYGAPVEAAAAGTVIFTGWMRGYGRLVILDNGNGLSTTYSHLSAYLVRVGERVARGQVIARVGSTGWSTGPHLLFEVREDGQPVNPLGP